MNKGLSVCFFFPYHEESGVPVLFYRMANIIAKKDINNQVFVIDYKNGATARNLELLGNLKLLKFNDNVEIVPPKDSILVMQSILPYYWPKELKPQPETKIFFWNLQPQNFIPSLLPFPGLRMLPFNNYTLYRILSIFYPKLFARLRRFVKLLNENKSISFMDQTNYDTTVKHLFLQFQINEFLPVPVPKSVSDITKAKAENIENIINFTWVGRLSEDKSHILVYTINKLARIAEEIGKNFFFHIVGDGPLKAYIQKEIKLNTRISVNFHGSMIHKNLDSFLLNETDILVAMGTSALEGAKLRIPTILLDLSFYPIKNDYIFRYLYETKNYDLGHFIDKDDFLKNNTTLKDKIIDIQNNYDKHAELCLLYFSKSHNIDTIYELFIQKISGTMLEFRKIDPKLLKKSKILKLYNRARGFYR